MAFNRELTKEELAILENLSAIGMSMDKMATLLGISVDTLTRMKKALDPVRAAIEGGRAKASSKALSTLYGMATGSGSDKEVVEVTVDANGKEIKRTRKKVTTKVDPNFQALKFWCETQEGLTKTENLNVNNTGRGMVIVGLPPKTPINRGRS